MRCCLPELGCTAASGHRGPDIPSVGVQVPVRSSRATGAVLCAALALLVSPLVRANNVVGAWDPTLYTWPLIPVHSVLTPDMRIVTYGTDGIARQTGYFIYDIWDIN